MNRTIFCRDIKITDKGFEVKASMDFRRISGAVLMSRNIQRPEKYVLKCETIKKKNTSEIKVQADLQVMDLYEGDWDLFLLDTEGKYLPVILSAADQNEASFRKLSGWNWKESYSFSYGQYRSYADISLQTLFCL